MAEKQKKTETKKVVTEVSENNEKSSNKNIIIIVLVVLAIILVILFIYRFQKISDKSKYSTSYLLDSKTVSLEIKNLEEVSSILTESPTEYFILISYTGDEDTYDLEVGLKDIIDEYNLSDSFYYLNVDSIKNEDNYITRLNNTFNTDVITKVPVILYYKDGSIIDKVERIDDNCIKAADFQKLLDIYDYEGL